MDNKTTPTPEEAKAFLDEIVARRMDRLEDYLANPEAALTQSCCFDDYQRATHATAVCVPDEDITYLALAFCGEAGEVADKVKKEWRDRDLAFSDDTRAAIAAELGDVLWYLSELATALGFTLSEVAHGNLVKIFNRFRRGTVHGEGDNR